MLHVTKMLREVAEVTFYTVQFFCNLCRNGVARQVDEKIAQCNTALSRRASLHENFIQISPAF